MNIDFFHKNYIIWHCLMIYMLIFSAFGTLVATFLGGLLTKFTSNKKKEIFSFFQNFSVGGIIALIFLELILESIEHFQTGVNRNSLGALYSLLIIGGVGLIFFLMHEGLHHLSHHHEHDHDDDEECVDHAHSTEVFNNNSILLASFIFLIAISVHNIPEGLSLGINFNVSGAEIPYQGIIMSIILFIHNFLIGFTMCNSFLHSNKSFKFALSLTTFSALPAFILAICGYFISTISLDQVFLGVIFAISTGSLLYVLFIELLPQVFKEYKSKYTYLYILLGIVLCGILLYVFGHHH